MQEFEPKAPAEQGPMVSTTNVPVDAPSAVPAIDVSPVAPAEPVEEPVVPPAEPVEEPITPDTTDAVTKLLRKGFDPYEVQDYIMERDGVAEHQANTTVLNAVQQDVNKLREQFKPEEIKEYIEDKYGSFATNAEIDYGSDSVPGAEESFPEADLGGWKAPEYVPVGDIHTFDTEKATGELIAAKANLLESRDAVMKETWATLSEDGVAIDKYNRMNLDNKYAIANTLRGLGRDVKLNDKQEFVEVIDGKEVEVNADWYSSLIWDIGAAEKEIGMGIAAGVITDAVLRELPLGKTIPGKLLGWAARAGADTVAAGVGAAVGRGLDLAYNAQVLNEELSTAMYKKEMLATGYWDAVMGAGIIVTGKVAVGTVKGLYTGFKAILEGNTSGAYNALKDLSHLDDAQIESIVSEWERLTGSKAPGSKKSQALHVIPQTQPGGEAIVSASAGLNPKLSSGLSRTISERAKDLNKATSKLTTENIGSIVNDDLAKYEDEVKNFYGGVKKLGTAAFKESDYAFNYDALTIRPMLKAVEDKITNPAIQLRLQGYIDKVENLGELRSFDNLLELRSTMNDFKYNTRLRSAIDYDTINSVIGKIDKEIRTAARTQMDDGDLWLKEWGKANTEYSKMLVARKNVLYKVLTKKGVRADDIVKNLGKYITSIDGTFMQVVAKLPTSTKSKVEGAILDSLVKKHTIGFESGLQATHFTNLAAELKQLGFATPEVRKVKRAINDLASVFKNDVDLSVSTGQIARPKFQSYLTTDPIVRAKYEVASSVFNYIKRLSPTDKGEYVALVTKVAEVLDKPTNTKAISDLIKAMPGDPEITSGLHQLALVSAKFGEKETYPKVVAYKASSATKSNKVTQGKYGEGIYWSTDMHSVKAAAQSTNRQVVSEKILPTRIATEADIQTALGIEKVTPKIIKAHPELKSILKDRGYDGFAINHDVLIFKE